MMVTSLPVNCRPQAVALPAFKWPNRSPRCSQCLVPVARSGRVTRTALPAHERFDVIVDAMLASDKRSVAGHAPSQRRSGSMRNALM